MPPKLGASKFSPPSVDTSFRGLGDTPPTPAWADPSGKQKSWDANVTSPGSERANAYAPRSSKWNPPADGPWSGMDITTAAEMARAQKRTSHNKKINYGQGWETLDQKSLDGYSWANPPKSKSEYSYGDVYLGGGGGAKQHDGNTWVASNESKGPDPGQSRGDCISPTPSGFGGRHRCAGWDGCADFGTCWDCGNCRKACECDVKSKSKNSWASDSVASTIKESYEEECEDGWGAPKKTRKSKKSQNAGWGTDTAIGTINEDRSVESDNGWGAPKKSDAWAPYDPDTLRHSCRSDHWLSCRDPCGDCGICPKQCSCNDNPSPEC